MAGGKTIIINGTSVKYGGAETILHSLLEYIALNDCENQFVLLCGTRPAKLPQNVIWENKQTAGLATLWFSVFGVLWYVVKYRAGQCLSLSNLNLILPVCKRITYFHQAKVFSATSLRFKLMAWAIHLLKGSTIVVQSPLIKQRFVARFGRHYRVLVRWPGLDNVSASLSPASDKLLTKYATNHLILWPVTSPLLEQKNLNWFMHHLHWLEQNDAVVLITSKEKIDHPRFISIGLLAKVDLMALYTKVDRVMITSLEETVCLPIFEAARLGARVCVLDRPYIRSIEQWRGLPANVQIFNHCDDLDRTCSKLNTPHMDATYFQSDWQIYTS